jgi:hypothetical protein
VDADRFGPEDHRVDDVMHLRPRARVRLVHAPVPLRLLVPLRALVLPQVPVSLRLRARARLQVVSL